MQVPIPKAGKTQRIRTTYPATNKNGFNHSGNISTSNVVAQETALLNQETLLCMQMHLKRKRDNRVTLAKRMHCECRAETFSPPGVGRSAGQAKITGQALSQDKATIS